MEREQAKGKRLMPKVLLVDPFLANDLEHFRRLLPEDVVLKRFDTNCVPGG